MAQRYLVTSEAPISVRALERPELPDIGSPENPWVPPGEGIWGGIGLRPGHGLPPHLPPRDEWPELPPGLKPPEGWERPDWKPEHPWVPIEPGEPGEPDPPPGTIWPPLQPEFPGLPDLSGKTAVLALLYVSRHAPVWRWVVIDHDEARGFLQKVKDWVRSRLPAGGIGGRPPQRPAPG